MADANQVPNNLQQALMAALAALQAQTPGANGGQHAGGGAQRKSRQRVAYIDWTNVLLRRPNTTTSLATGEAKTLVLLLDSILCLSHVMLSMVLLPATYSFPCHY